MRLIKYNHKYKEKFMSLLINEEDKTFIEDPVLTLEEYAKKAYGIKWEIFLFEVEEIIGYYMIGVNRDSDLFLDRFLVDGRKKGKGYGRLMFQLLLDQIKKDHEDINNLYLSVNPNNTHAIHFYEHVGFILTPYTDDDELIYHYKIR